MIQKSRNFLELALDDYLAARLLLRTGLLAQGVTVASTAIEKYLKAALALRNFFTKKHMESGLLQAIKQHYPELFAALDEDFLKFLQRAFKLRYASTEAEGFSIVINQHRTLIALDQTVLGIDSGFKFHTDNGPTITSLQYEIEKKNTLLLEDNVALGAITLDDLASRPNSIHEICVEKNLRTLQVQYQTDGLNVVGSFCKKSDISSKRQKWQLARG